MSVKGVGGGKDPMSAKKYKILLGEKKLLGIFWTFLLMFLYIMHKKTYIFAHMSVKAYGGGGLGLKALADMSAKNVSFLDGSPNNVSYVSDQLSIV